MKQSVSPFDICLAHTLLLEMLRVVLHNLFFIGLVHKSFPKLLCYEKVMFPQSGMLRNYISQMLNREQKSMVMDILLLNP